MTPEQFSALAQLLRLRTGAAREGVRLVLVEGMIAADAAALCGVSQASLSNALARIRRGLALAREAVAC